MDCGKARSLIIEEITGTLEEGGKKELYLHRAACPRCEKEFSELGNLVGQLKSLPLPDPGDGFWKILPYRVEDEIARSTPGFFARLRNRVGEFRHLHPSQAAYAFASMAAVFLITLLLVYPRFAIREKTAVTNGDMSRYGIGERLVREYGYLDPVGMEDLTVDQLDWLYSTLLSSAKGEGADQVLTESRFGGISQGDIGSELNELNGEELELLTRKLYSMYPELNKKGAL